MARKNPGTETTPPDRILQTPLEDVMREAMMPYSEHVILERALPRVEDGLKPVQRRILYTMSELGLMPDRPHRKSVRIVGDCLGKYHPHGDTSVYDAMVRMAQPYVMRGMLVDGHGNFGSIDGDAPAAMRYTEARMTPLALEMLRDLEKDTVPQRLNFDDTLREPEVLPSRYPNLLVNGASGIAVGMATNIPPHNLGETIRAVIAMIEKPGITVDELMVHLPGPDFPTGGLLVKTDEIRAAYETGRGRLLVRARVEIEDGTAGRKLLVIKEIPYQISKSAMLEKILKLSEEKRAAFGGIHDIRDESDRDGMRAVIELKRDVDPKKMLALLYKYSDLQATFGVNIFCIAEGKPRLMGLIDLISHYIEHQKRVVTRRTRYELEKALARLHILEGLIKAVDQLDEIIAVIRASENAKQAKERLMPRFDLTDVQAQAILDLRLQRLTGLEILLLRQEHAQLLKTVERLESILKSERKLMNLIKTELTELSKQYEDPRRTEIISEGEEIPVEILQTREPEEAMILFTRGSQLRRIAPKAYDKLPAPEEDKDLLRARFETLDDATLYFFTDQGNCYVLGVDALTEANRPKDRGTQLTGLLAGLEENERVVRLFCLPPGALEQAGDVLMVTKNGTVKRSAAADYAVRKSKFAAINLRDGDRVLDALFLSPGKSLLLISERGLSIHLDPKEIPVTGRTTAGVRGMGLDALDKVCFAALADAGEGELLLMTDRGYAKRVLVADFELQGRGGKGVKCVTVQKNGANGTIIAGAMIVTQPFDFYVLQQSGQRTRMSTEEVTIERRPDKGKPYVLAVALDTVQELLPVID